MNWSKLFSRRKKHVCIRGVQLINLRDDLNDNIKQCTKLLYRLEEAELQIKVQATKLAELEARKQDRYYATKF